MAAQQKKISLSGMSPATQLIALQFLMKGQDGGGQSSAVSGMPGGLGDVAGNSRQAANAGTLHRADTEEIIQPANKRMKPNTPVVLRSDNESGNF